MCTALHHCTVLKPNHLVLYTKLLVWLSFLWEGGWCIVQLHFICTPVGEQCCTSDAHSTWRERESEEGEESISYTCIQHGDYLLNVTMSYTGMYVYTSWPFSLFQPVWAVCLQVLYRVTDLASSPCNMINVNRLAPPTNEFFPIVFVHWNLFAKISRPQK